MILLSNEVMSALHTPVSYTSGSSSELSETASTEENKPRDNKGTSSVTSPINSSVSRIPTIWKRMRDSTHDKDAESKRPPWRAVSISTLPKPDKNALLRAKLLDASRRLRATKIAVGVQTDIVPSKLMKDVALGPQTNLILLKDFGVLTDGSYTKRRDGTTEYILTYSVAQMTDSVKRETVSTQTLIPRLSGDAFLEACSLPVPLDQLAWSQCTPTEKILLKKFINMRDYFIPVTAHFKEKNMHSKRTDNDLHAATVTIKYPNQTLGCNTYSPNKLYHTEFSWNFEYDSDYIEYAKQLSSYTTKNNAHKSSLAPCGEQNSSSLRLNTVENAAIKN
ncbi:uncharacterized protein LOC106086254 isoform X2 [Stomoxys calcitrans]|uniref:Uncharacterized protein n=1 Tax=Stomoxys calcitrans TaxID=35570 RepID=A0A1I8PPA2_STOCA|nr:uncharacterized protein LOC106086254 isoform X2 [Stomoxys calcitrans]